MTAPGRPWTALAAKALTSARDHDLDRALTAVNAIGVQYGGDVIPSVLLAWIDTMVARCNIRPGPGQAIGVLWQHENGGPLTEADDTPPGIRWAGRAVAARLADDQIQFRALVNSCASDDEWQRNVVGVLDVCSTMLRQYEGGAS